MLSNENDPKLRNDIIDNGPTFNLPNDPTFNLPNDPIQKNTNDTEMESEHFTSDEETDETRNNKGEKREFVYTTTNKK